MAHPAVRRLPRATLRPAQPGDAALIKRWREEPESCRHQPLQPVSLAQLRTELGRLRPHDLYRCQGERFQWMIMAEDRPCGWITAVVSSWDHGLAEIGYTVATAHQRQGIMTAALDQLLLDLFMNTNLRRLEARCAVDNIGSRKVLERVGFQREARLRGYFILNGEPVDNFLYAILVDDYLPALMHSDS